jgi:hypothetical protein
MEIKYPWAKLKKGEGFFVPCLDTEKVREAGLRASLPHRISTKAVPGVKDGLLGVWFYRRHPDMN